MQKTQGERRVGEWEECGPMRAGTTRNEFRSGHSLPDDHPSKSTLVGIEEALCEALELPTEWLPSKLRDRKNKRRSIRFLQKAVERKGRKVSQRDADKMAKEDRIANYRWQVTSVEFTNPDAFRQESAPGIQYREDEMRVYNAHLRFCRIVGLITQEDIDG